MRTVFSLVFCFIFCALSTANAQNQDGTVYPWCPPAVNRVYAMLKENNPLAPDVHRRVVGNDKVLYDVGQWPAPVFPENPEPKTLLTYRVRGGSYYWWYEQNWSRIASEREDLERTGLIYSIGQVEKVVSGAAVIDLGDVHTLRVVAPFNKVTVFRIGESGYVPVGVLKAAETFETYSRMHRSRTTKPQPGDVVMLVREMSQMKPFKQHNDDFIKKQLVKSPRSSVYTNVRIYETAKALRSYYTNYRQWQQSKAGVIGFLNGTSFEEGRQESLEELLNYIGMMRDFYRQGRESLPAAGVKWQETVSELFGATVMAEHEAARSAVAQDDNFVEDVQITPRDVRRAVQEKFFSLSKEQQNMLSFLVATMIEADPGSPDVWFRRQLSRSQFPELVEEEFVLEEVREILRDLQGDF